MTISTRAATAAGFALTLMLTVNCNYANAQQAVTAPTYQAPSAATASMVETPAAPQLQGASCGTIGPQGGDAIEVIGIDVEAAHKRTMSGDALMAGKFDGLLFLRTFSSDIDQFKGKIAEKALSFVESLQSAGRAEPTVVVPSGYTVIRQPVSVSPAVF